MNRLSLNIVAILLTLSTWQAVHAQAPVPVPVPAPAAAIQRYTDGVVLERRGDHKGAFAAFLESAEGGHGPAQRRVAEIYDHGNSAVERDYPESIRWYQLARERGEPISSPPSPIPSFTNSR